MPLDKSGSKASIGKNIAAEESAGRPRAQAVAIALDTARRAGGDVPKKKSKKMSAKDADKEAGESMKKEMADMREGEPAENPDHAKGRGKKELFEAFAKR